MKIVERDHKRISILRVPPDVRWYLSILLYRRFRNRRILVSLSHSSFDVFSHVIKVYLSDKKDNVKGYDKRIAREIKKRIG